VITSLFFADGLPQTDRSAELKERFYPLCGEFNKKKRRAVHRGACDSLITKGGAGILPARNVRSPAQSRKQSRARCPRSPISQAPVHRGSGVRDQKGKASIPGRRLLTSKMGGLEFNL